jgi:dCMP deaminase
MKKQAQIKLYMDIAYRVAQESYCGRGQVGACIVTPRNGIYIGYNGMPSRFPNVCEIDWPDDEPTTDPLVIHAEQNCLLKMLREGVSPDGAIVYQTLSPCIECTKWLYSAGIKTVVYGEKYRSIDHLTEFRSYGMKFIEYEA